MRALARGDALSGSDQAAHRRPPHRDGSAFSTNEEAMSLHDDVLSA
jgi:hypothetical protein